MRLYPAEKNWPSFNDSPHERPYLTYDGEARAFAWLVGIFGGLTVLAAMLTWLV